MTDRFSNLLLIACLTLGIILLWAISIGITYWDASRRRLAGGEIAAWVALAALIPGLGFAAYLFARLLGLIFSPGTPTSESIRRRVTALKPKPQPRLEPRTGTLLAADIQKPTIAMSSAPQGGGTGGPGTGFVLTVVEGPQAGREYRLESLPLKIGRGQEADIRLDEDLGISRQHAELYEQSGSLRIRDLKSTHGTQVNGSSIDDTSLDPGDRIQVGLSTLVLHLNEVRQ